jgi:hypothetical protein
VRGGLSKARHLTCTRALPRGCARASGRVGEGGELGEVAESAEGCGVGQDLTENSTLAKKPDGTRLQVQM